MRYQIWVLPRASGPERAAEIADELVAGGASAQVRNLPAGPAVVIEDATDDLRPPDDVVHASSVEVPPEYTVTRRTFIDSFATAVALAVAGAAVGVTSLFASPPDDRHDTAEEIEVATLDELRRLGAKVFRLGRDPGIVILSRDKLYALSLVCTHLGCLVEWDPDRRQLVCPCHRAAFDLGGNVLAGPPPRPLPSFEVTLQGERVLVRNPGRRS